MTGTLTHSSTTGNNPILISSSLQSANNAIQFINSDNTATYGTITLQHGNSG